MKRELGIARCGLACCLCSENVTCAGCDSGQCPDKDWCENRKCTIAKNITHCYDVMKRAEKDCWVRLSPMPLQSSPEDMGKIICWTVWNEMRKTGLFITGRA